MDQQRRLTLSRPSRLALIVAFLATAGVLAALFDQHADRAVDHMPPTRTSDHLLLPPVPVLRALGLGQDTLVATGLWLKALAYFGEHFTRDRKYRWLLTYIETIKALDPRFRRVFEWGGVVVMYGGRIDNNAVRTSNRILEEGVELFPDDWQLAFMLGCNYVFELRSEDKETKRRYIETGIEYVRRAASNPKAPPHLTTFVSGIYRKMGWLDAAASYLEEAYLHTENAKLREELGLLLEQYRDQSEIARLQEEVEQLERERQESFPYLPPGLFRLVGARSSGRIVAWTDLLQKEASREQDELLVESLLQQRFVTGGLMNAAAEPSSPPAAQAGGESQGETAAVEGAP